MLRTKLFRIAGTAALIAVFVAAPVKIVPAAAPQEPAAKPASETLTPEQRMNKRYPQAVKVGFLVGLPVLDEKDATYGYIREVVRTGEGKIVLVVPYRAWLGWAPTDWGRKTVAVPIETVAILARQVAALDFSREDFAVAPVHVGGVAIDHGETIRIAVYRR